MLFEMQGKSKLFKLDQLYVKMIMWSLRFAFLISAVGWLYLYMRFGIYLIIIRSKPNSTRFFYPFQSKSRIEFK